MLLEGSLDHSGQRFEWTDGCGGPVAPGGTVPSRPYTPSPSPTGRRPILRRDFAVPPRPERGINFSHRQLAVFYITLTEDAQAEGDGGSIKGYGRKAAIQFCRAFATTSESWFIW